MTGIVMIVGARQHSLGAEVMRQISRTGLEPVTYGLHDEDYHLDLVANSPETLFTAVQAIRPQHVVCTVGMNMPEGNFTGSDVADWYRWHYETNVTGPLRLFEAFRRWSDTSPPVAKHLPRHYVAISSNSATIPRSSSAAYCASKAALSMALRVKAREAQGGNRGYIVYGYEPGLLEGTPMTSKTAGDFPGMALHRMRGEQVAYGIPVADLAAQIVAGLEVPGVALNGTLARYDAGEL